MKFTGERVIPSDMKKYVAVFQDHIARYTFALDFVVDKLVLDAACGTGYGVDLMSNVAKKVYGCDIDSETIELAKKIYGNFFFIEDLNYPEDLDNYDVITSFETIEHLTKPENFLEWASRHCKTFIFSIPINAPSEFHKQVWNTQEIKELINKYFNDTSFYLQVRLNFYYLLDNELIEKGIIVGIGKGKS